MRNVISRIQPDKIQQRERTHGIPAAQLHRVINILDRPDALFIRANRIEQIRHQQPVHDESRLVRSPDRDFAQLFSKLVSRLVNVVGGRDGPHDFHQLHQRHWIKKMQPHKPLRPLHRSQQLRHRNRRSIRSENRIFLHDAIQRRIHFLLLVHILDDGLDDDVAIGEVGLIGRTFEPRSDRAQAPRRAMLDKPADARHRRCAR